MPIIRRLSVLAAASVMVSAATIGLSATAQAQPATASFADVPSRTSISYADDNGVRVGTANEDEARPGLSTVKLYMADYVLRFGDGSASERDLAARLIQVSDDGAGSTIDSRYPGAISAIAAEYGLTATSRNGYWGNSSTSTADTVRFLQAKMSTDPASPILGWMRTANPIASDGTEQNWGTAQLPFAIGSKWGWADDRSSVVASASIGEDFVVASNTYGPANSQTADVLAAFEGVDLTPAPPVPDMPTLDELLAPFCPAGGPE